MIDFDCRNAEVCVIGRTDFTTGIGAVAYSACELLSRYFPTTIYPINSGVVSSEYVQLPNGKQIPVCRDLSKQKVFFYTDVLWNGEYDLNYKIIPDNGLRIAHVAYDSDALPPRWVEILNSNFDIVFFSSSHLEQVAKNSGVTIAIGTLPIGLDIEGLLSKNFRHSSGKIRFGCVAAYHPRKNIDVLVDAFIREFKNNNAVELLIHSNLQVGDIYQQVADKIRNEKVDNIILSNQNLDHTRKNSLIESIDIFVNCSQGEGYSIGPREALALGKILILSDVGPHRDLFGLPGTFAIPTSLRFPARYPEIDNQIFGYQYSVSVDDTQHMLSEAISTFTENCGFSQVRCRRARAAEFSFHRLALNFAEVITPFIHNFKKSLPISTYTHISPECTVQSIEKNGYYGEALSARNRYVLPAHDGGFFSVFNAFMSHLVWEQREERCHMVLPDWDVSRLIDKHREHGEKIVSFCYGKPTDGNIWSKLFEPLYGLTEELMNDVDFLYGKSSLPETIWNQHREPLLTYIHAYDLYKQPSFPAFRKQYHTVFKEHIKLREELQNEINNFSDTHFSNKFVIAAHVKHPSHMIEQPGKCIAHGQAFIDAIIRRLNQEGFSLDSDGWQIFLATDQDRVVAQFKQAFGARVVYLMDVRRTRVSEDELYDTLSDDEKAQEGFQVQHLVAANPDNWSTRMAWEVIRDAMLMSRANVLFHVVSNVSTAVSYFNPDVELLFVD